MNQEIAAHFDCRCAEFIATCSKRGLHQTTRVIEALDVQGKTILELGCGPGELALRFAKRGATWVHGVDLSSVMIEQANTWAMERGLEKKAIFRVGDGATMEIPKADLVVLDRIICCYPHWEELLDSALDRTKETIAIAIPRDGLFWGTVIRVAFTIKLLGRWLSGDTFRPYVHPNQAIEDKVREAGFRPVKRWTRYMWRVDIYRRADQASG